MKLISRSKLAYRGQILARSDFLRNSRSQKNRGSRAKLGLLGVWG